MGVVTAVDGLTFLADGDGVFGFRFSSPLSLTPSLRLRPSLLCGAELEHLFQISHVPSPPPPVEAQFVMDSEFSRRMLVSLVDVVFLRTFASLLTPLFLLRVQMFCVSSMKVFPSFSTLKWRLRS